MLYCYKQDLDEQGSEALQKAIQLLEQEFFEHAAQEPGTSRWDHSQWDGEGVALRGFSAQAGAVMITNQGQRFDLLSSPSQGQTGTLISRELQGEQQQQQEEPATLARGATTASMLLLSQQQGGNNNSKGAETASRGTASKIAGTAARGQPRQHGRNAKDPLQDGSGQVLTCIDHRCCDN